MIALLQPNTFGLEISPKKILKIILLPDCLYLPFALLKLASNTSHLNILSEAELNLYV
jgi:hypothetical protein